jgi:phosphoglycerate dehydrogenase-like enzyme
MSMNPEILLIAAPHEEWPQHVKALTAGRLVALQLDPNAPLASDTRLESVRVLVGAPQDLSRWMDSCPRLEWIQSTWAGVDALASQIPHNVVVTPLKHVFGQAMSEFVMGWILSIERRVITRATASKWDSSPEPGVLGKTMGILGTGSIGQAVAQAAGHFGIRCKGLNSNGRSAPGFVQCYTAHDPEFFNDLDYVVSVLPKTDHTTHLINSVSLSTLPKGSIIVNIGRGNAIDDQALLSAVKKRQVKAAVLDVFNQEPLPESHPYWLESNVYVTSHTAAPTMARLVGHAMANNLSRFIEGKPLVDVYEPTKGY